MQKKSSSNRKTDISFLVDAYSSQIDLFGSFLRETDSKRDQFVRFYLSVVLSALGFSLLTFNNQIDSNNPDHIFDSPLLLVITFILITVLIVGLLTFSALIKFRILHSIYVKLINRTRGYMVQSITSSYPEHGSTMQDAWQEYIHDDKPPFLQKTGLEQSFSIFVAFVNTFLGSLATIITSNIISKYSAQELSTVEYLLIFTTSIIVFQFGQIKWMENKLRAEDKKYRPKMTTS